MNEQLASVSPSKQAAMMIASICPDATFCGFNLKPKANGDVAKIPVNKSSIGVAADTSKTKLVSAQELPTYRDLGQFWGVVMQSPIPDPFGDMVLTILDLDTKRSNGPQDIRLKKLLTLAKSKGLMIERSHSKKGGHIIFLTKPDERAPAKINLGNDQEIEIFGQPNSAGKSVMLTGDSISGDVITLDSTLTQLLLDAGITEDVIWAKPVEENQPSLTVEPAFPTLLINNRSISDEMTNAELALNFISPDCDYEEWIELGQALHNAFGEQGYSIWAAWSSRGTKYQGEKDLRTHWKSFKADGGVKIGTLFHIAKQNGYVAPTKAAVERTTALQDFQKFIEKNVDIETGEVFPEATKTVEEELFWKPRPLNLDKPKAINYLLDGFLAHSFSVLAGQPGVGKTTSTMPLALAAMGVEMGCLRTSDPRPVIWVSEDPEQVQRLLYAYIHFEGVERSTIERMFILIDAKRVSASDLAKLAQNIALATVGRIKPWLIIDTASATMSIRDENDNAAVAEFVSAIKETIYIQQGAPITVLTHTAKALGRNDEEASARGASAWEGDATLTATLFMDEGQRYMKLRKTRYEPAIREIRLETRQETIAVTDELGRMQDMTLTWAIPFESSQEHRESIKDEAAKDIREMKLAQLTDECHTELMRYASELKDPVIYVGIGNKATPDGCTRIKLRDWILELDLPGLGKKDNREEVIKRLKNRLGAGDLHGFLRL